LNKNKQERQIENIQQESGLQNQQTKTPRKTVAVVNNANLDTLAKNKTNHTPINS